jgi:hypothetical protein
MADVERDIILRVKSETDQATGQFKNLKQELRSIENELNKMSEAGQTGTKAFQELQRRAGEVKDQIGDTKSAIKALSSDTFKLDAFAQGAQAIAGGFAAAQGAMALFGSENKEIEEAIKKTQGAMALLQGVTSITNLLQKESALMLGVNTVAQKVYAFAVGTSTGAMKAFKIALMTTGILAIVGAIVMAADAMGAFGDAEEDAEEKIKKTNEALKERKEALDQSMKDNDKYMQRTADIVKNEEQIKNLGLDKEKNYREINKLQKDNIELQLRQIGVEKETKKGLLTKQEKLDLDVKEYRLKQELGRLDGELYNEEKKREEERKKKQEEKQKKAEERRKQLEEQRKKNAQDFIKRTDDEYNTAIELSDKYYEHLINQAILNDQDTTDLEIQQMENRLSVMKDYGQNTIALEDQIALKKKAIKDKNKTEQDKVDEADRLKGLDTDRTYVQNFLSSERFKLEEKLKVNKEYYLKGVLSEKEYLDNIDKLNNDAHQKKKATLNEWADITKDGLSALSELSSAFSKKDEEGQRKAFERDKKFRIASAIIQTAQGVAGQLAVPQDQLSATNFAKAAIVLATGIAQIKKISDTKYQGGTPPSSSTPTPSVNMSPNQQNTNTPNINSTMLNVDAQGNLVQNRSIRTYVVESDISQKQKRSRQLSNTAIIGK